MSDLKTVWSFGFLDRILIDRFSFKCIHEYYKKTGIILSAAPGIDFPGFIIVNFVLCRYE